MMHFITFANVLRVTAVQRLLLPSLNVMHQFRPNSIASVPCATCPGRKGEKLPGVRVDLRFI